jgi:hypothetical protein
MNHMITLSNSYKLTGIAAALATIFVAVQNSQAATITLDFEGVGNTRQVREFYNGGTDSAGNSGTNYGISFGTDALGIIDSDAPGGTGNFGGEPSPSTVLFFLGGSAAKMNVAAGFDTGFSFFYSAINNPGFINVYDGLNGTGNILTTLSLPTTPNNGAPDPTGQFSPFLAIGVSFSGVAKSVDFGGTANQIAFDNITLGAAIPTSSTSVPEPFTIVGTLVGAGTALRMRKRLKVTNKL